MKSDSPKKTGKKSARKLEASPKTPAAGKVSKAGPSKVAAKPPATAESQPAEKPPVAKGRAPAVAPKEPVIPPLLLEGDSNPAPRLSGPGERFVLGALPLAGGREPELTELPESYGTQRLMLAARDPRWLYAHWDFSQEQLRRYNARSAHKHLVLRIYKDAVGGEPHREIHVHPESRSWFAEVGLASTRFVAELGYPMPEGGWVVVATSAPTVTPADTVSDDLSAWFETLPVEVQFDQLLRLVRQAIQDHVPLMEAVQQLRSMGYPGLPDAKAAEAGAWTPEQERALAEVVSVDAVRRVWMGSMEITELIRRQYLQELSSQAAARLGEVGSWSEAAGAAAGLSSLSSPFGGGGERRKGFWFNVNAELIIYGATEPDATVTIGGRTIRLRPDGTFSYRFILPDGQYDLPAIATSSDGTDSRTAALAFRRATEYRGDVRAHPQDPSMRPPLVRHVS